MAVHELENMDQIQREKIAEKLVNIKALAERGVGGEKETAVQMYEALKAKYNISDEEIKLAAVALLHDICKADAYKTEKKSQKIDGKWQEVDQYTYTNHFPVGHSEKSIIQIMRFMELTDEEIMAIRWHMGGFDPATKGGSYEMNYAFAQSELAAMLHIADMMATHLDEREVPERAQ